MTVRTRYAPSPTGALHIGNVRSGLFAYLFARHNRRRIHPAHRRYRPGAIAPRNRSTKSSRACAGSASIGTRGRPTASTSSRAASIVIARARSSCCARGKAYPCYCTAEELDAMRKQAEREHRKPGYDGRCRDRRSPPDLALPDKRAGRNYTIRFRSPREGETVVDDLHQGPRGLRQRRARRPDYLSLRRRADLQLRHRARRRRLRHHPRRARRRPSAQHAAPDADLLRARTHAARVCASADGDGAGRAEALQAPRRDLGLRLSRSWLFSRGAAQLPGATRMVARRPGDLLQAGADRVFRFRHLRQVGGHLQRREAPVAELSTT